MLRTVMAMNFNGLILSSQDRHYPIPFHTVKTAGRVRSGRHHPATASSQMGMAGVTPSHMLSQRGGNSAKQWHKKRLQLPKPATLMLQTQVICKQFYDLITDSPKHMC